MNPHKSARLSLLITSIIFTVIVLFYWVFNTVFLATNPHPAFINPPTFSQKKSLEVTNKNDKLNLPRPAIQPDFEHSLNELQLLPNKEVLTAIKVFWRNCQARNNCEAQLKAIERGIDTENSAEIERYTLIKEYPERINQFNQILQHELTTNNQPLAQKVDKIKAAYESVWGTLAPQLFFDELAFYEQRVQLDALYHDNQNLPLEDKAQVLDDWIKKQHADGNNTLEPYQAATLFFSAELIVNPQQQANTTHPPQPAQTLALNLAQKYLSPAQAAQQLERIQRQQHQHNQANSYQSALSKLQQTLLIERESIYSNLSLDDWATHKEQRLREFKMEFFK